VRPAPLVGSCFLFFFFLLLLLLLLLPRGFQGKEAVGGVDDEVGQTGVATMTTFADATSLASERLATQYQDPSTPIDGGSYWFLGDALHAYLRSLLATGATDEKHRLLQYAYDNVYLKVSHDPQDPGVWRDDYGWWGCAFCVALRNRQALCYGNSDYDALFGELLEEAKRCWCRINRNWRDITYSAKIDHAKADADIQGGAANQIENPPEPMSLAGRNTVTNAGFWLLSLELETLSQDPPNGGRADRSTQWFDAWISRGTGSPGLFGSAGLVLERPTGNRAYPTWCWTGDQGVVMVDLLRASERAGSTPSTNSLAAKIAAAVIAHMTVKVGDARILTEDLRFRDHGFDDFTVDYSTGKGICMRHLGDACRILGPGWRDAVCGQFIRDNASAVWDTRDTANGGQIRFNWSPPPPDRPIIGHDTLQPLVFQASGLDALSVAASFWPHEPIG
jgi:hypothetical protein